MFRTYCLIAKCFGRIGLLAISLLFSPVAFAQIVSSGLTGSVRDTNGSPIAGATVNAVHNPTNASFTALTNEQGRYHIRGLPVGGPYSVSASAAETSTQSVDGVTTQLGSDLEVNLVVKSEIVKLDKFTVTADSNDLNATGTGAGSLLDSARLEIKPTAQRSLADLISASPLVTLRATIGDREESQLSAVGQNNRYNSIQIDGARINDQFGLNMTGLASFFNPLSIDTIEQLSVDVSPYDVRQSGFTGATINAVTKSGANRLFGTVYYIFGGDELAGIQMQGEDVSTRINTGAKVVPTLERTTYGLTLGGPIWKDHLFFFVNYEKFERISAPGAPGLLAVNDADMTAFTTRLAKYNTDAGQTIPWGENIVGTAVTNITSDEKKLAKIDWQISSQHRASVRYSTTEGDLPQYGKYQNTQVINNTSGGVPTIVSSGATALSTHIYTQKRLEEVWAGQVFSQWSPDFSTELKYSQVKQDQDTPLAVVAPEVAVFGLRGTDRNGVSISDAAYVAGTEFSRQGNEIHTNSKNYSATGDYIWRDFVISAGVEREETDFYNLFKNGSYGTVVFSNLANFLDDKPSRIERNVYDPALRPDPADISSFATNGVFGQVKWNASRRLTFNGGIRFDVAETDTAPPFNANFLAKTGFDNSGTADGATNFSPRVGFNLALDDERMTQLRGGIGHFLGRAPWVIFSNSYNNPGVGSFTVIQDNRTLANQAATLAPGAFNDYLKAFDVENPIGVGVDNPNAVRQIDWVDDGINLPSVWRGNLALDHKVPALGAIATLEVVQTVNDDTLFIVNENLRPSGAPAADGRTRFSGAPSGVATNSKFVGYTNLYHVRNETVGSSTYISLALDRPMKNDWSYNISYTRGDATDAQSFGQTTASGQWQRNVVFNQGTVEESTSDFEVRDRIQISVARQFELFRNWKTTASLYYEARTGEPFSWVYANDLNGDGQSGNDTVAVPDGASDSRFDFSRMTAAQVETYLAFFEDNDLARFAGGVAAKNAFHTPWINRLDLRLSQRIPIYKPAELELFLDFINFGAFISEDVFGGYFVEANQKHFGSEMFRRNRIGNAVYGLDGRIIPQQTSITGTVAALNPDKYVIENGQSRWRIQIGARLRF